MLLLPDDSRQDQERELLDRQQRQEPERSPEHPVQPRFGEPAQQPEGRQTPEQEDVDRDGSRENRQKDPEALTAGADSPNLNWKCNLSGTLQFHISAAYLLSPSGSSEII